MRMSALTLVLRSAFVVAVAGASLLPGLNVLGALVLISLVLAAWTLLQIWFPADRRRRASGPPGTFSGDRFPRRPLPSHPSASMEIPEPT